MHLSSELQENFFDLDILVKKLMKGAISEQAFWCKFDHHEYSEADEQYLLKNLADLTGFDGKVMSMMGGILLFTQFSHKNIEEGLKHIKAAIALGNMFACNNLGVFYASNRAYVEAFHLYQQAAAAGIPAAQHNLARAYWNGTGTAQDLVQGFTLFKLAANNNYSHACYHAARIYDSGQNVPVDKAIALQFYKKAVDLDNKNIQALLFASVIYNEQGKYDKEISFLKRVILQDPSNITALNNLAISYYEGDGVVQNYVMAAKLSRKARAVSHFSAVLWEELRHSSDIIVQYHCNIGFFPSLLELVRKHPKIICQQIILDDLLTLDKKLEYFFDETFQALLSLKREYNILAEFYLYFAESYPERVEEFCNEALNYLYLAEKFDRNLANKLFYFLATQYQYVADFQETMRYCLKTRNHVLANYLLAHVIFTHYDIKNNQTLQMLCLYLLKEKSVDPSPFFDRDILIANLIHLIKGNKGIQGAVFENTDVDILLSGKALMIENTLHQLEFDFFLMNEFGSFSEEILEEKMDCFFKQNDTPVISYWERKLKKCATEAIYTNFFDVQILLDKNQKEMCLLASDYLEEKKITIQKWMFFSSIQKTAMPENIHEKIFRGYVGLG